eukprot:Nitzschia sp. Nitz4//scaffold191_size41780//12178//13409//NITZ4_007464-RA/size41780-augustus-gene-0.66-mRNA-1//-1//CDS//3329540172//2658//frame0
MSSSNDTHDNVGVAMGLVCMAGASTGLGAAVVFFPSIVKLASRRVLAASLGFSAGVMTYISFVEIVQKSNTSFLSAGHADDKAYIYSTLCFFAGVLLMMVLNVVVSVLLGENDDGHGHGHAHPHGHGHQPPKKADVTVVPPCCNSDPVHQLEDFQRMAAVLNESSSVKEESKYSDMGDSIDDDDFMDNLPLEENGPKESKDAKKTEDPTDPCITEDMTAEDKRTSLEKQRLVSMGMNTALAVGLHNFPEGLATFVAALHDPSVGSVLAFAIAIHNIPEGLCVALPIYYANGNRLKAFLWAIMSGISEIIAALLGWAVLANVVSDDVYAVLFGIVAGMMVIISIRELLPTAHFYDPEDSVTTYAFISGMMLIALSLVLFKL